MLSAKGTMRTITCIFLCAIGIAFIGNGVENSGQVKNPASKGADPSDPKKVPPPKVPPQPDSRSKGSGPAPGSAAAKVAEANRKKAEINARIKEEKRVGGVLYEQYSTALHTKRLRNEFTRAEWKTILLQKRIRIPLTAQDHHDMELFFIGE